MTALVCVLIGFANHYKQASYELPQLLRANMISAEPEVTAYHRKGIYKKICVYVCVICWQGRAKCFLSATEGFAIGVQHWLKPFAALLHSGCIFCIASIRQPKASFF